MISESNALSITKEAFAKLNELHEDFKRRKNKRKAQKTARKKNRK